MKKKRSFKRISAICASAVLALTLGFGMRFSDIANTDRTAEDSADNVFTETVEGGGTDSSVSNFASSTGKIVADSASGLHFYENGESYWYIDYATGVRLGDGDTAVTTDIVVQTVTDNTVSKGTLSNPYVIDNTVDAWNKFVSFVGKDTNKGLNKVFVLNGDIDFGNSTVNSVEVFNGTFIGNGYTLSNLKYKTYTNQALGLFCRVKSGSAFFSNFKVVNASASGSTAQGAVLVGHSDTNITVTGVTVTGTFTITNPTSTACTNICSGAAYTNYGGIIGNFHGKGTSANLYKCSATMNYTETNNNGHWTGLGGLIGCADGASAGSIKAVNVYDCYSAVKTTYSSTVNTSGQQLWTGIVGFTRVVELFTMKRCISIYDLTATGASDYIGAGLAMTAGQKYPTVSSTADNYVLDHIYGYGNYSLNGTKYAMPLVSKHSTENITSAKVTNCLIYSDNGKNYRSTTTQTASSSSVIANKIGRAHV